MAKTRALRRVRQDIAHGRLNAAVGRLRTLLAVHPGDVELYLLLAKIHRDAGNPAEAGRWGYLTDEVTPAEIRAFEQAHPAPWVRLRLIGWQGDPWKVPSEAGRARLRVLLNETAEATVPIQRRRFVRQQSRVPARAAALATIAEADTSDVRPATADAPAGPGVPGTPGATGTTGSAGAPGPGGGPGGRPGRPPVPSQRGSAGGHGAPRVPRPRTAGRQPAPPGAPPEKSARNFLLLALLIIFGAVGSVAAVIGFLALFGVHYWPVP